MVTGRFADWAHVPWIEVRTLLLDPGRFSGEHKSLPKAEESEPSASKSARS